MTQNIMQFLSKLLTGLILPSVLITLSACSLKPTDRGQQYDNGEISQPLELVNQPDAKGVPVNDADFYIQIKEIEKTSSRLYRSNSALYQQVTQWLQAGGDTRTLAVYRLNAWQMPGADDYGNVLFTGYYTPLIQVRAQRGGKFQYPLYGVPAKRKKLPSRRQIHAGALSSAYVLAWSNSLIDNFIMEVQGSGYVDFADNKPAVFFGYAGKNGYPYRSIGKVLIERGEIDQENMSMQAIRQWADSHNEAELRELLEQNPSYVFFKPRGNVAVTGASAVPLIAQASVASDPTIVAPGSVLLAEVPLLNDTGKFTGHYQLRMLIALDVGGAIKGQHFDIYQGIGDEAGERAGWLNHYGRVWLLKTTDTGATLLGKPVEQ